VTSGLPDSLFTAAPRWEWLIVFYFFIGGIAGGSYFLAALIDLVGGWEDRRLARLGYYIALPAVIVSGLLLIVDLTRPLRFWHMLIESNTWRPMLKWWSPMSIGSWALLLFGLFAFVSFVAALADDERIRWRGLSAFRPPHPLGVVWTGIGGLFGFFVAGYTGVLLSVTNRPVWSETNLLGLAFLLSGASTAAALLLLLAPRRRWAPPGIRALERFDTVILVAELVVLVAIVASVWSVASHVWFNWWGLLLVGGVVIIGIILPLALQLRPTLVPRLGAVGAALLVLIGGFLLRVVFVLSPEHVGRVA
jgi:formate-dependent nitrite reductase membrane component NrfD